MKGITPFLWFNDKAEDAANFYVSVFQNSRVTEIARGPGSERGGKGEAMSVSFELAGQPVIALNGGPAFRPTPAFSFFVSCSSQRQVDALWKRLTAGGRESQCGWLKDRYGVSWQIIPTRLPELLSDPDPGRANRALAAMMKMRKIDIRTLERAADEKSGR